MTVKRPRDRVDLVSDKAVCLATNSGGGLGVGRLDQAKDLALVLVDTVTQVLDVEVGLGLQAQLLRRA